MLMLTVLHICLATNGRSLHSRAHAIKGRLMLPWVTSCVCTTPTRSLKVVATSSAATYWDDYDLSPIATYGITQGAVQSDF
jgi:hypothetical protein